jgi:hypothetical protein
MDQHQIMGNPKDETTSKELRRSNRSRSKLSTFQIATTQTYLNGLEQNVTLPLLGSYLC